MKLFGYVAVNDCARERTKQLLLDKLCYFNSSVGFTGGWRIQMRGGLWIPGIH